MKKLIFVDGQYEYDLEVIDDTTYTLYYSNGEQWQSNIRGEIAFQCIDTGNGFKMTKTDNKNMLDYSEAGYLYILLREIERCTKYEVADLKEF